MTSPAEPPDAPAAPSATVELRVRYPECDPMGFAHHSVFPVWMEIARAELLRRTGVTYAQLEQAGTFIVVVKMSLSYKRPARYDDRIEVTATVRRASGVRIDHDYAIHREHELLCSATTTLACLNQSGRVQPVPDFLQYAP